MPRRLSDMIPDSHVMAQQLADPEFRAEWDRTAPARAVAVALASYRANHDLSQRQLAARLGVSQSVVARWEIGEHNPTFETLRLLAAKLGIEFAFAISPASARAPWLSKKPVGATRFDRVVAPAGASIAVATREPKPAPKGPRLDRATRAPRASSRPKRVVTG